MRGAITWNLAGNRVPFLLPRRFRPSAVVFVVVALQGGAAGQLEISPDGEVRVHGFLPAQDVTSLEGVSHSR